MKKLIESTNKEIKSLDRDLTLKQKKFLQLYFQYGNGTKAALEAYDTHDIGVAANIASENLRKLQNPIRSFMESKGMSLGRLYEVLDQGLKANRVISAVSTDKHANGATTDFIEVPDHLTRHKFMETASRWLGVEQEKEEKPIVATQVNINLDKYIK